MTGIGLRLTDGTLSIHVASSVILTNKTLSPPRWIEHVKNKATADTQSIVRADWDKYFSEELICYYDKDKHPNLTKICENYDYSSLNKVEFGLSVCSKSNKPLIGVGFRFTNRKELHIIGHY